MSILSPLKKSLVLYGDAKKSPESPSELIKYAELFLESGELSDALNFYYEAGSEDGVRKVLKDAISNGDFFFYHRGNELMGWEMERNDLINLAENAKAAGKLVFARDAYIEAGEEKKAEEIEK